MVKHWPFQMVGPRMTWCMSGIHTSLCRSPATSPCRGDSSSARLATTPATWQLPQVRTLALQWTILQLRGHCVSISWRKLLSWVYKQSFIRAPQMLVLWKASLILETWLDIFTKKSIICTDYISPTGTNPKQKLLHISFLRTRFPLLG